MKTTFVLTATALFAALAPTAAQAQTSTAIAGSGFNLAAIVTGTPKAAPTAADFAASTNGTLDGFYDFYTAGYNSAAPTTGLPNGGTFQSGVNANVFFTLQPASPLTPTNNVFEINATITTATFTVTVPAAYNSLSFLVSGFNGSQSATYTLNYSTGAPVTGNFTAPDNFNSSPVAFNVNGRARQIANGEGGANLFANAGSGNPRLYEVDLNNLSTTNTLQSITFGGGLTGTRAYAVFAVSGSPVPEPSTYALALVGGLGLLGAVRRSRATRLRV